MRSVDLLKSVDIFAQLPEDDLSSIARLLKENEAGENDVVFRQGDMTSALFIVASGGVRCISHDAIGRERPPVFLGEGQSFGEMALLAGEPMTATMQAVTHTSLLVLRKDDFDRLLGENFQLMLEMTKVIARRQAARHQEIGSVEVPRPAPPISEAPPSVDARVPNAAPAYEQAPPAPPPPVQPQAPTHAPQQPPAQAYVPAYQPPPMYGLPMPTGKAFTVFSPKGGVGKSTIAVNLAVELAHQRRNKVVLLDLSLSFGHDMLMLNLSSASTLASTGPDAIERMDLDALGYYLTVHPGSSLRVLPGAKRPEDGELVTGDAVKVAIEQLKRYFEYIVIDTGSNFSDPVLAGLEAADRVLMICSPEITVLHDIRDCQRILNDVVHIKRDNIHYVMNYIFPFKALSVDQFVDALQRDLYMELPYGGDVPARSALRGEALVESQRGSGVAKGIQKLAAQLMVETAEGAESGAQQEKKRGFFR